MNEPRVYPYLDDRLILGLRAGDDFIFVLTLTDKATGDPVPMPGFNAALQLRDTATDALLLADDSITGSILVHASDGTISFATTAALTVLVPAGICKYGLRLTDGSGKGDTLLAGPCDVAPKAVYS